MNRRDVMKLAGLAALATTYASAYEEKLIINKKDMALKDPANPSDFEYKHMPEITLGNVDAKGYTLVEVSVGQKGIIHPSIDNHWIYKIELYVDGKEISSVELEPTVSRGYLATRINLQGVKEIKSIAKCNLHGNYSASITL
jgi:desulfoferrodoxin (superoxide reductase-like protein)